MGDLTLADKFLSPPKDYRPLQIIHDLGPNENWESRLRDVLGRLERLGLGGIVTNVGISRASQRLDMPVSNDSRSVSLKVAQKALDFPSHYLLNDAAWNVFLNGVRLAKEQGFRVWLYDEEGYPSGAAGGLTLKGHPELEARGIFLIKCYGEGNEGRAIDLPDEADRFIHARVYPMDGDKVLYEKSQVVPHGKYRVETQGMGGRWLLAAFAEKTMFEGTHAANNVFEKRRYINILNAEAVKRFIELTYDAYAYAFGSAFSQTFDAAFTDEPSTMVSYLNTDQEYDYAVVPWDAALPDLFAQMHGYELWPHLLSLFEGDDPEQLYVRRHFYDTVTEMISTSYFQQIADWCDQHGIQFSGHLLLEERLAHHALFSGSLMQVLRHMHAPGVDMLTTKPERVLQDGWYLSPKYVSSVAHVNGRKVVMSETSAHMEVSRREDFTLREMIGTANLQYLLGVNLITSYYDWVKFEGGGNDQATVQLDSKSVYTKPNYAKYNEYVGRLSVMLRDASHAAEIGVYYPIESAHAYMLPSRRSVNGPDADFHPDLMAIESHLHEIAMSLLTDGRDFNFIDAEALRSGDVKDGHIRIGTLDISVIVMPSMRLIPVDVLQKLQLFEKRGGHVIWSGRVPDLGESPSETEIVRKALNGIDSADLLSTLDKLIPRRITVTVTAGADNPRVFVGHYFRDGEDLFFLVNASPNEVELAVNVASKDDIKVFDPWNGDVRNEKGKLQTSLTGYGSLFIF